MRTLGVGLICLWTGAIVGILTAGILHSSADADRDCYWQEVAHTLANWTWGAAHSHGVSEARRDEKPSETLDRAILYVNRTRRPS